jgi:hypothetical protein
VELTSFCSETGYNPTGATGPIGYFFRGGPPPGVNELILLGCASEAPGAEGIQLSTSDVSGPGTYANGGAVYTDAMGMTSTGTSKYDVTITSLGQVGQAIEGTFDVTTQTQGPAILVHFLGGSFHVCHVPDENAP